LKYRPKCRPVDS